LIVTFAARTTTVPAMSLPSTTAPAWVIVMLPDGVRVTPAGTPVLSAPGQPVAGGAVVVLVGVGLGDGVGDGVGEGAADDDGAAVTVAVTVTGAGVAVTVAVAVAVSVTVTGAGGSGNGQDRTLSVMVQATSVAADCATATVPPRTMRAAAPAATRRVRMIRPLPRSRSPPSQT
jgi:hypothetical protein